MRTLMLMRHAKSDWTLPAANAAPLADKERPLAKRGVRDAPRMAAWMASAHLKPDLILCSSAVRTRQTLELIRAGLGGEKIRVEMQDAFYLAEADHLIMAVRACPDKANRVMLIGHDPGLHDAANLLIGAGPAEARNALAVKFPTAAVVVIDFDVAKWKNLAPGTGRLRHFMAPKRLPPA